MGNFMRLRRTRLAWKQGDSGRRSSRPTK